MGTQVARYGRMRNVEIKSFRCRVRARWTSGGSVLAETITSACEGFETELEVESDDDPAKVAAVLRDAERGCYVRATLVQPVPVSATARLNGQPFDYGEESAPSSQETRRAR